MSSSNLSQQDPKLASALDPEGELTKLISNGQLTGQASAWLMSHSKRIIEWSKRTDVHKILLASGITFGTVFLMIAGLGFGSVGIGGGTIAAGIQSIFYGGLTPAGGLFATLQSMGMTGALLPMAAGIAGGAAAMVTGIFNWFRGREHQGSDDHQHEQ